MVVDIRLMSLRELKAARNAIHPAILEEISSCLVETEGNVMRNTLFPNSENPIIMARTGINSRLSTYRHLLYRIVKICGEIHRFYHRRNDDALMLYGQRPKDRKAIVCHTLILNGTSHEHIIISVTPVIGNTFHETVYALGEEVEPQVLPYLHHLPAFRSPRISIFQKEIGGEARENDLTALYFPCLVALALQRQIESRSLTAQAARSITSVHLILTIYIAIPASGTYLRASVPRIPICVYAPILRHYLRFT